MAFPEAPQRIREDQEIRALHNLPNDLPCDQQADDAAYCGGTIMAEYLEQLPLWSHPDEHQDYTILCLHHHHRRALHRYQHAYLRDQEHTLHNR